MRAPTGFFWPSYADLLTALFVVMMVLFVLSFRLFREREEQLEMFATNYKKIKELELALHRLDESPYFEFQPNTTISPRSVNTTTCYNQFKIIFIKGNAIPFP